MGSGDRGVSWGGAEVLVRRFVAHREALALGSLGPLRSSAARAAHREALALGSIAPLRSSAARAALRGASPLPHLLQRAMACEAIVASLVGMTQFFGWRCRRPICLQSCDKADNHGLTGTARCNKCRSGLARDAPRGRRSICASPKNPSQASGPQLHLPQVHSEHPQIRLRLPRLGMVVCGMTTSTCSRRVLAANPARVGWLNKVRASTCNPA